MAILELTVLVAATTRKGNSENVGQLGRAASFSGITVALIQMFRHIFPSSFFSAQEL